MLLAFTVSLPSTPKVCVFSKMHARTHTHAISGMTPIRFLCQQGARRWLLKFDRGENEQRTCPKEAALTQHIFGRGSAGICHYFFFDFC